MNIQGPHIHPHPLNEEFCIQGVKIIFLEANHCPGAVLILFKCLDGKTILHCGDFRAEPKMESYPEFWNVSIDEIYLDTTYCNPRFNFPSQTDVIEFAVNTAATQVEEKPRTLFVCGAYTIGKEKVFCAIAEELDCKIWAPPIKQHVLKCLNDPIIDKRLISNEKQAQVHVLDMGKINVQCLKEHVAQFKGIYTDVVGFKPTGWEYSQKFQSVEEIQPKEYANVKVYGIPYSEHSSYDEMKRFVQFLNPKKIIPTVNVGKPDSRKSMENIFSKWFAEAAMKRNNGPKAKTPLKQQNLSNWAQKS